MNNIQRLCMEIKEIELEQNEITTYLQENGLEPFSVYNPNSNSNKRAIYVTAMHILESIANNPTMMASIRIDDMTASDFYENLLARIDQLERKVRQMNSNDNNNSSYFLFYN